MAKWVMACKQNPLGTQLGVETKPLAVTSGLKTDSPNAVINIESARLFHQGQPKVGRGAARQQIEK